jgi:hypothetical protein
VSPFAGERDKPNGFSAVSIISNIFIKLRGVKAPSHKIKAVDILDATINEIPTMQKMYKKEDVVNE